MELLSWEYDSKESGPAFAQLADHEHNRGRGRDKAILAALGWVGLGSLAAGIPLNNGLLTLVGVITGSAALLMFGLEVENARGIWSRRRKQKPNPLPTTKPPSPVRFTSTGVVFGDTAALWHGEGQRIVSVGIRDGVWPVLVLGFTEGTLRLSEKLEIPVPPQLRRDVEELTQLLDAKTKSGLDTDRLHEGRGG